MKGLKVTIEYNGSMRTLQPMVNTNLEVVEGLDNFCNRVEDAILYLVTGDDE